MSAEPDLAAFYEGQYAVTGPEAERFRAWRALGAVRKASNVISLAEGLAAPPARVVELGCGDGALLAELAGRGFADTLAGVDISESAVALARARPGVASADVFDGDRVPSPDGAYDVAILSHVLEHVADPVALLGEAGRVARAVILEVPLEDNRSARRSSRDAIHGETGHIQRFSRDSVARLVGEAGLAPQRDLTDPLTAAFQLFFAQTSRDRAVGHAKAFVRAALHRASPRLAAETFTVHYAALCTPR